MTNAVFRLAAIVVAGLLVVAGAASPGWAAPVSFTVALSGAHQVPVVQTSGTGTADLTFDPSTRVVSWSITYSGMSSPATMAHFHGPATADKNATVEVWLTKKGGPVSSPIKGEAMLTEAQARQFEAGQMYINVHSQDHPAGEIRGQVVPPKS